MTDHRGPISTGRIAAVVAPLALVAAFVLAQPVAAANYTVDPRTGKKLTQAIELLQAEDYAGAAKILKSFNLGRLNDYEKALVQQTLGYVAASQEDFAEAAERFSAALELESLPEGAQVSTRFNLAQIYMMLERWDDAIATFNKWFQEVETPNSLGYYMLAVAYYQSGDLDKAFAPATKSVEMATTPKEAWIRLLLALYMEKKQYREALPLVERLVSLYPKKPYWMQLSAIYAELGEDSKALASQQLAYQEGFLTEDKELRRLAQMYLFHDLPFRAATVLDRAIEEEKVESDTKALELLGNSWLAAREYDRALAPLERAAEVSEDGELFLRLGRVYIQREEWEKAAESLNRALEKGNLEEVGNVHLLLGIAVYNQKRLDRARRSFVRALDFEESNKNAEQWLRVIDREMES
jgi:tetratricopeptide (TPR) repeat protein